MLVDRSTYHARHRRISNSGMRRTTTTAVTGRAPCDRVALSRVARVCYHEQDTGQVARCRPGAEQVVLGTIAARVGWVIIIMESGYYYAFGR